MGKKIDEFFKEGLTKPDLQMQPDDWVAMERVLDKHQHKYEVKSVLYIWLSGIAAILIVGFFLFDQDVVNPIEKVTKKKPVELLDSAKGVQDNRLKDTTPPFIGQKEVSPTKSLGGSLAKKGFNYKHLKPHQARPKPEIRTHDLNNEDIHVATDKSPNALLNQADTSIAKNNSTAINLPVDAEQSETYIDSLTNNTKTLAKVETSSKAVKTTPKSRFGKSLVLSIQAGSDLNAVGSFKNAGFGTNAGILLTWQFTPKISLTSGIAYAKKLYDADYKNYMPTTPYSNMNLPTGISADCRVLDIPFNINYSLLRLKKGKIIVSGGASSYIMLSEKYDIQYTNYVNQMVYKGENQHYLGVLNFAMAYERMISQKTSISFQPYLKLPITGIGQENVNLISTGLSVNFNINTRKK